MNAFDANIALLDSANSAAEKCQLCGEYAHPAPACPVFERVLDLGRVSVRGMLIGSFSGFLVGLAVGRMWF